MKKFLSYCTVFVLLAIAMTAQSFALAPPSQQAKYIGFSQIQSTTANVLVGQIGNGEGRIIAIRTVNNDWTATDAALDAHTGNFSTTDGTMGNAAPVATTGTLIIDEISAGGNLSTLAGLTGSTTYYVKIYEYEEDAGLLRAYNTSSVTLNPRSFTTVDLLPPTLNGATVSTTTVLLNWDDADNATGYYLDVREDNGPTLASYDLLDIGDPASDPSEYLVTGLTEGTIYQYRLRSYDNSNISAATAWTSFTTLADETAPTLTSVTALVGSTDLGTRTPPAVNEADASGSSVFKIKLVFSETMNTTINPTVDIDGSVGGSDPITDGTLTFTFGSWSTTTNSNDTYTLEYSITDDDMEDTGFDVTVSNSPEDLASNAFATAGPHATDLFDIDLEAPVIGTPVITTADLCLSNADGDTYEFSLNIEDGTNAPGTFDATNITASSSPATNNPFTDVVNVAPTYDFAVTIAAADASGDYEVTVVATDDAGNTRSFPLAVNSPDFTVDNTKPVFQNLVVTTGDECTTDADDVTFTVEVVEDGCAGTFDENDLTVTSTTTNQPVFSGPITGAGTALSPYVFTYTIDVQSPADADASYDITVNGTDRNGNVGDTYTESGAFTVDNTLPVIADYTATTPNCIKGGQFFQFTFTATETGCGTFDQNDVTVTSTAGTPAFQTKVGNLFTYKINIGAGDVSGDYDITIAATDDAGNTAIPHTEFGAFSIDKIAPIINSVTADDACYNPATDVITLSVDVSESGCGSLGSSNFVISTSPSLTNGFTLVTNPGGADGVYVFEAALDPADADGDYGITVNLSDPAGNTTSNNAETFTLDETAPVFSAFAITGAPVCTNGGNTVTFTFDVTEEGCGTFGANELTITDDVLTNDPVISSVTENPPSSGIYNVTATILVDAGDPDGTVNLSVSAMDYAGNTNAALNALSFEVDNTEPAISAITITGDPVCDMVGDVVEFSFTTTELGCGTFDANDINVAIEDPSSQTPVGTLSSLSFGGGIWTASYTIHGDDESGQYTITVDATDDAGNSATQQTNTFDVDNTVPAISNFTVIGDPVCTNGGNTVTFTFEVVEDDCGDFDETNLVVTDTGLTANPVFSGPVTGTGTGGDPYVFTYTIAVAPGDASGPKTITIVATDEAGNTSSDVNTEAFRVDNVQPSVANLFVFNAPVCENVGYTVQFKVDAADAGCGTFDENDITISIAGGGILTGSVVSDGNTGDSYFYHYEILAPDGDGSYDITADISDDAGNTNTITLTGAFNIDQTDPVLNGITVEEQPICENAGYVVEFSVEATEGTGCGVFNQDDISVTLSGGSYTPANLVFVNQSPLGIFNYTYTIAGTETTAMYDIDVLATDDAGNTSTLSETNAFYIDNDAPAVSNIAADQSCYESGETVTITFQASDVGCGTFDQNDLTVSTGTVNSPVYSSGPTLGFYTYTLLVDATDTEGNYDITVNAMDDAGNTTTTTLVSAFGIDKTAPTTTGLAVTGAPVCVNAGTNVYFTFEASDLGCGTFDASNITVTVLDPGSDGTSGTLSGHTFTGSVWEASYQVGTLDTTGTYTILVDATDDAGNTATQLSTTFEVDNTAPVVTAFTDDAFCLTEGDTVTIEITATDIGCGTFDENDFSVWIEGGMIPVIMDGPAPIGPTTVYPTFVSESLDVYTYEYIVQAGDPTGFYEVYYEIFDDAGNQASPIGNPTFEIDNDAPELSGYTATSETCLSNGDMFTFEIFISDEGCGTFGSNDLTVTITPGTTGSPVIASESGDGTYSISLAIFGVDATGDYDVDVSVADSKGNVGVYPTIEDAFSVDNTAPEVTSLTDDADCVSDADGDAVAVTVEVTDAGCGTFDGSSMTVTADDGSQTLEFSLDNGPASGSGTYTFVYDVIGTENQTMYDISVVGADGEGNALIGTLSITDAFTIDHTAPTASLNVDAPTCVSESDVVTFDLAFTEDGCGTFDANNITVTLTPNSGSAVTMVPASESPDNTFNFTYTVTGSETSGNVDISWTAMDYAGNTYSSNSAIAFYIDNDAPELSNLAADMTCASAADGDDVTITFNASDVGCGSFNSSNITVNIAGPTPFVTVNGTPSGGGAYSYVHTVGSGDPTGTYTVTVNAMDEAGNTNSINSLTFDVDNTAPSISNVQVDAETECIFAGTRVDFTFDLTEEGCGTIGPGAQIVITSSVTTGLGGSATHVSGTGEGPYEYGFITPSDALEGSHSITITATDSKGNTFAHTVNNAFTVDNSDPVVSNLSVTGSSCLSAGGTVEFTFDVVEEGCGTIDENNVTVTTFTENTPQYDGVSYSGGIYTFTYTLDITGNDDGDYNVMVDVEDNAGNTATYNPAGVEFTVDNSAPVLSNLTVDETCVTGMEFESGDEIEIMITATDDGCGSFDETSLTLVIWDESMTPVTLTNQGSFAFGPDGGDIYSDWLEIDPSDAEGTYRVVVEAMDGAGNTSSIQGPTFTIDQTAPDVTVDEATVPCTYNGDNISFDVDVFEDGCGTFDSDNITVTIDPFGAGIVATTSDVTIVNGSHTFTYNALITGLSSGTYDILVEAVDAAGNIWDDLASGVLEVDGTAPSISGFSLVPEGVCLTNGSVVDFDFDVFESGCGTFDASNITVTTSPETDNDPILTNFGEDGNYYVDYQITLTGNDEGTYDIIINVADDAGNTSSYTEVNAFTVDNTAPSIDDISVTSSTCLSGDSEELLTFDVTVTEEGCGTFDNSNLTVSILGISPGNISFVGASGGTYSYSALLPFGSANTGDYDINVVAMDEAGNTNSDVLVDGFSIDNTAPVINSIAVVGSTCVSDGSEVTFEVDITDEGCGTFGNFNISTDLSPLGASASFSSGPLGGGSGTYTYIVTIPAETPDGNYNISIDAMDSKGNNSSDTETAAFTVDNTAPALTLLDVSPEVIGDGDELTISVDATDAGCATFGANDLDLQVTDDNDLFGAFSGPTVSGNTYTWTYTATSSDVEAFYDVTIFATDGNGNTSSIQELNAFEVQQADAPTVENIVRALGEANPTNANSVVFTVNFSENVNGVSDANFSLTTTGTASGTIATFGPVSGTSIDVTVNSVTGDGTIRLDLDVVTGIVDNESNLLDGTHIGDETFTIDNTAPEVVSINRAAGEDNPTNASSVVYTVTFDGNVSGIATGAFSLTSTGSASGTVASVSAASGTTVDVTVNTVSGDGTLRLDLTTPAVITDEAGNSVAAVYNGDETFTIDNSAPQVNPVLNVVNNTTIEVVFSEDVDQTMAETASNYDLTSDNGTFSSETPGSVSYNSGTFTATLTLTGSNIGDLDGGETLTATVTTVEDIAGNVVDPANDEADYTYVVTATKLVITTVIPNQTTGVGFMFTVQSQTAGGSPAPVDQNTPLNITIATGTGTLSVSGSPSIANGNSSTTVTVTYTKAGGETGVSLTADNNGGMELTAGTSNLFNVLATEPSTQASGISFSNVKKDKVTMNWTTGNGSNRIVVGRLDATSNVLPTDGTAYASSTAFGSGNATGSGNYVVYNGNGNNVTVTNLNQLTTYSFRVYEYNGSGGAINYNTNTATNNPKSVTTTLFKESEFENPIFAGATVQVTSVYPIPATTEFTVDLTIGDSRDITIKLYDMKGSVVMIPYSNFNLSKGEHSLKVTVGNEGLPSGTYNLAIEAGDEAALIPITIVK